jgi:hypothetical protein
VAMWRPKQMNAAAMQRKAAMVIGSMVYISLPSMGNAQKRRLAFQHCQQQPVVCSAGQIRVQGAL